MHEYNFDEMSYDDLLYFRDEYIKMFELLSDKNNKLMTILTNNNPNLSRIDNIDLTPAGKVAFVAKKLVVNTLISFFTGIDSMYLDNDISGVLTRTGRYKNYLKTEPDVLSFSIGCDLKKGLEDAINLLKNADESKLRNILKKMDEAYFEYSKLDSNHKSKMKSFGINLCIFLESNLKALKVKTVDKAIALKNMGYSHRITINFFEIMVDIHNEYYEKYQKRNAK